MAGYIFNLDSIESLKLYTANGVYATKLKNPPTGYWMTYQEGTFADYSTMKAGDNVYFFIDRKIYGIGELVEIGGDCKFSNFPEACKPENFDYSTTRSLLLWDEGDFSIKQRWLCVFKPSPYFFINGVDMDDILGSNPSAFRMLRAFWKVSFLKFDDQENQAFKDVIFKFNQDVLNNPQPDSNIFQSNYMATHARLATRINQPYKLDIIPILENCASSDQMGHEMALEAGILYQMSYQDPDIINVFGKWEYLSHQVIASPFKPIDYMDKMDIFGYSFIQGFNPTKSKYLVVELKKDDALKEDIDQLLKYVDWVKDEYCFGDYSMIDAFLVAYSFPPDVLQYKNETAERNYTIGRRPARSLKWANLKTIKYTYDQSLRKLEFSVI
jgi:hypothetical protein